MDTTQKWQLSATRIGQDQLSFFIENNIQASHLTYILLTPNPCIMQFPLVYFTLMRILAYGRTSGGILR